MAAIKDPENTLIMDTTKGKVVIALRPDLAPDHVARIKELAREGFYDGVVFHRVIDGFMAQGGDPTGTGTGGSKKPNLQAEFYAEQHVRGVCSMARTQQSQQRQQPVLHLLRRRRPSSTSKYTVWGEVIEGMENVDALQGRAAAQTPARSCRCGWRPTRNRKRCSPDSQVRSRRFRRRAWGASVGDHDE